MHPTVLSLRDDARGRALPTTLYVPPQRDAAPLIVFGHGFYGHPRKFTRLLSRWADEGYVVAAPAFPHTNDGNPPPYKMEDVVNQPGDVSFVLDELLARGLGEPERIGVGGFSLGAETALAVGLHPEYADARVRAVVAIAGALFDDDFVTGVLRPVPLLLVHGTADTKNDRYAAALAFYERAHEPKRLVALEGAGHDICQDSGMPYAEEVAEVTTAFWREHLHPVP